MSFCTLLELSACDATNNQGQLVEQGGQLFESRALSASTRNIFTCASCHDASADASAPAWLKTGAPLAGVTLRSTYWGGHEIDLLSSVDACRRYFMNDTAALSADSSPAQALYAYLVSLEPGDARLVSFTVQTDIADVPRGVAAQGTPVFARACALCHGATHTGAGRLADVIPVLPEDAISAHAGYDARTLRLVFIEKIRHGGFLGYPGVMPPFSLEVLPDTAVSDLLEMFGVLGVEAP